MDLDEQHEDYGDLEQISMYNIEELMGEHHYVSIDVKGPSKLDITIENYEEGTRLNLKNIHIYAADTFAAFCRDYLHTYEFAKKSIEQLGSN